MNPTQFVRLSTLSSAYNASAFIAKHRAALALLPVPGIATVLHKLDARTTFPTPALLALRDACLVYLESKGTPFELLSSQGESGKSESGKSESGKSKGGNSDSDSTSENPYRRAVHDSKAEIVLRVACRKPVTAVMKGGKPFDGPAKAHPSQGYRNNTFALAARW